MSLSRLRRIVAALTFFSLSSPTVFRSIGVTGNNTGLFTTGIFGVIKTIGGIAWCFLIIDHFGRRGILLVGSVGGALSMYAIAAYIKIANPAANPTASLPPGEPPLLGDRSEAC